MVMAEVPELPAETVVFVAVRMKLLGALPTVKVRVPVEDA
jgi:hypothetical protein